MPVSSTTPQNASFLQKVGGGYIFIHRMLMEHFAQMELER
jgi:hypothetical protein